MDIRVSSSRSKKTATRASEGHKQAIRYLLVCLRDQKLQQRISKIRKKYGIPSEGFQYKLPEEYARQGLEYPSPPPAVVYGPPSQWLTEELEKHRLKKFDQLAKEVWEMLLDIGYYSSLLAPSPLLSYVFFNEVAEVGADKYTLNIPCSEDIYSVNSCAFFDVNATREEYRMAGKRERERIDKLASILDKNYPIVLRIRADATQNQVWGYISKAFDTMMSPEWYRKEKDLRGRLRAREERNIIREEVIDRHNGVFSPELKQELRDKKIAFEKTEIALVKHRLKERKKRLR